MNLISFVLNRRSFLSGIILIIGISIAQGQQNDLEKQRNDILAASPDSLSIEEKLVALALKGPRLEASDHQNKINEYQLKKIKNSWLNLLSISTTFNATNSSSAAIAGQNYIYPRYLFGVNVPLGIIFSKGSEVKSAKESIELSKNNQEQLSRDLKVLVLTKYRQYQNLSELIQLQNEVVNDEQAAFLQKKEKFRTGDITIEEHNTASKNYTDQVVQKLNLELQQYTVKLEIENMIGTNLESVVK